MPDIACPRCVHRQPPGESVCLARSNTLGLDPEVRLALAPHRGGHSGAALDQVAA